MSAREHVGSGPSAGDPAMRASLHAGAGPSAGDAAVRVGEALDLARRCYWERPAESLATAIRCQEAARTLETPSLRCRALALQGAIALHRGDLRGAFALTAEAEPGGGDDRAGAELAAVKAHLEFFSGAYSEALRQAERAIELADRTSDTELQAYARRAGCIVFGNVGVRDWPERLDELLGLAVASGNRWEEAISRNDVAHHRLVEGDAAGAGAEIERGMAVADELAPDNTFVLGVLHCTRAELRLGAGEPGEALADAERAIELLSATGEPNPYLLGMTVRVEVQALLALGRLDDAQRSGEAALDRLGDRVPQARSLILETVATALRDAGRLDDAYSALARSAELERQAFREMSELQLGLERARLAASAARQEADALAARNRELEEQADRDWLTGLHNRRYLARELERLAAERLAGPFSLAVLDLDHFKSVNDRFGHDTGDRVLVRVAALLLDSLRRQDTVVRTGGEEFVVLMAGTEANAAAACCARLCAAVRDEPWHEIAAGMTLTASIGIASADDAADLESLARLADRRLYEAKDAGRDRVAGGSVSRALGSRGPRRAGWGPASGW